MQAIILAGSLAARLKYVVADKSSYICMTAM